MKTRSICSAVLVALGLVGSPAFGQQQDFSKVNISTEKITDAIYMLSGAGGNIGLAIGNDAVFLIDDQFAPLSLKIRVAIAKVTKKPVKFLLNTHWHSDHTGGNENFGKGGALIIAHENVRKRMLAEQFNDFLGTRSKPSPKAALPVLTFTAEVAFHLNGDEIHVFHVPNGHSDGDAIVHFKRANAMHLGDIFFNRLYPFIDGSSGGSPGGVIAAVDRVLKTMNDGTRLIPGHGPQGTKADLSAYRDMLHTVSTRVQAASKEGKKLEEVLASKPTAEFDAVWGKGFFGPDKFVEMLWKNLHR